MNTDDPLAQLGGLLANANDQHTVSACIEGGRVLSLNVSHWKRPPKPTESVPMSDTREPMTALEIAKFKAEAGNRPGLTLYRSDPDDEGAPVVIRKRKPQRPLMDQIDEVNRSHLLLTRKAALLRRVSALLDGDGIALRTLEPMVEALWRAEEFPADEW